MRYCLRTRTHVPETADPAPDYRLVTVLAELTMRSEQMLALIDRMAETTAAEPFAFYTTYYRDALQRLAGIDPSTAGALSEVHKIADEFRLVQRSLLDTCLARRSTVVLGTAATRDVFH